MNRLELKLSDEKIFDLVSSSWNFKAKKIKYIDVGSTFAFILENALKMKVFLKLYKKATPSNPIECQTVESLALSCRILEHFSSVYNLKNITAPIKTKLGNFYYEDQDYILIISNYIAGANPRHEPNELKYEKLASIFSKLHTIPILEFAELKLETFNIDYALGIEQCLKATDSEIPQVRKMIEKFISERELLTKAINMLIELQNKFVNSPPVFIITHGDGHHFNVLQNKDETFLIDWENIKLAPRERDLWHYASTPLIDEYLVLNPGFNINYELCKYYHL